MPKIFKTKNIEAHIAFLMMIAILSSSELIFHLLDGEKGKALVTFCFSMLFFLIPVFLFRNRIKLYLKLLLPIYLLLPFNILYVIYFDSKVTEATILMILNTNRYEAIELLRNYFIVIAIVIPIYLLLLYILYKRAPQTISKKWAASISVFALGVLVISPIPVYNHSISYLTNVKRSFYNIFPGTVVDGIENVCYQNSFIKLTQKDRDNFKYHSVADSSIKDKQIHILIIGESSRYDHWGINGYVRNTTPRLSKQNHLIAYSNTAAGGFMTEWAAPLLLTGVGADNYELNVHRKGIAGIFNEAGFNTYWITNQTDILGYIRIHSLEAQKGWYLLTDFRSKKNAHMDMELVDTLKKVLAEAGNKKFIVLHTLGSHYNYSSRYPDNFDVFKPSNKTTPSRVTDRRYKTELINSYDNSIVYSDAVIDSVINMVSKLNAFSSVTYIADHGEDLFDDSRNLSSHHLGAPPSKYIAHIPFFIWYSPKLQTKYPNKTANLIQHKNAKTSSENLIYTLTGMVGISYPLQNVKKDISSASFEDNKQLIMGEGGKVYAYHDLK